MTGGPNLVLQRCLDELAWKPESLVARINEFARRQGSNEVVHPKTAYSWLLHGRRPRDPTRCFIAAVLSENLSREISIHDLGWYDGNSLLRVPADWGLKGPCTKDSIKAALRELGSESVERRDFLTISGASVLVPAQESLLGASRSTSIDDKPRVDSHTLSVIDQFINSIRLHDDSEGGDSVKDAVRSELRFVTGLLDKRNNESIEKSLHAAAAELARLMGWTYWDCGEHALAERSYIVALRAARYGKRPDLAANAIDNLASVVSATGSPADAVALIHTALMGTNTTLGNDGKAALRSELIRAEGKTGDARAVATTENVMFENLATHGDRAMPSHLYWVEESELLCWAGVAYLELGDLRNAEDRLEKGISTRDPAKRRESAMWLTSLARVHLLQNRVEEACIVGLQCIELLAGLESPRAIQQFNSFRKELKMRRTLSTVRDMEERAHSMLGAA